MLPDRLAFISYKSVRSLRVRMGNNSYAPVLGRGTAIVSLNGKRLLIRNVLHVPALRIPLYSLRAHLRQRGCGFVGSFDTGMHVYFPGVVLSVDMSTDCHLSYEPLGKSAPLSSLHYVQPRCAPVHYPAEGSAFRAGAALASTSHFVLRMLRYCSRIMALLLTTLMLLLRLMTLSQTSRPLLPWFRSRFVVPHQRLFPRTIWL